MLERSVSAREELVLEKTSSSRSSHSEERHTPPSLRRLKQFWTMSWMGKVVTMPCYRDS